MSSYFDQQGRKNKQNKGLTPKGALIGGALLLIGLVGFVAVFLLTVADTTHRQVEKPLVTFSLPAPTQVTNVYSDVLRAAIPEMFNNLEQCVTEEVLVDAVKLHNVKPKAAWNVWVQKDVLMQLAIINPISAKEAHIQSFYFRPDTKGCLVEDPAMYSITQ